MLAQLFVQFFLLSCVRTTPQEEDSQLQANGHLQWNGTLAEGVQQVPRSPWSVVLQGNLALSTPTRHLPLCGDWREN